MTREQSFFLQLLSDGLHARPTEIPGELDWPQLLAYGRIHQLSGFIWTQCGGRLAERPELRSEYDRLSRSYASCVFHYTNTRVEYERVQNALIREGIPYIPVKGIVLAPFYREPSLRTMGDVDLMIRPEDRDRARAVMEGLGFRCSAWGEDQWQYAKSNAYYELHSRLLADEAQESREAVSYFNGALWDHASPVDGTSEHRLDWDFHFLFLVVHIAKHMRWKGVGFRMFFDLAVLIDGQSALFDWEHIRAQADALGYRPFTEACLAFCERWFGVRSPIPVEPPAEAFYEAATEKMFLDGVFGFDNEENRASHVESLQRGSSLPMPLLKLSSVVHLLFPSYRRLRVSPKYEFLNGRPYLLPAAWLYRVLAALRQKRNGGIAQLKGTLSASSDSVAARKELLAQWGL